MDGPTGDIIAPGLVEVAKGFGAELRRAVFDRGVLLVFARAALLDHRAETLRGGRLDLHAAVVDARGGARPGLQVGDPGLVFFDGAAVVEAPEGDLAAKC